MKIDKLTQHTYVNNATSNFSYNTNRGKLNGLMISTPDNLIADLEAIRLTVKLRTHSNVHVLVNRMTALELALVSQIRGGYFSAMGVGGTVSHLLTHLNANDATALPAATMNELKDRLGDVGASFFIDLGHISLGEGELEITGEVGNAGGAGTSFDLSIYSYHRQLMPDMYKLYDESYDLEQSHSFVRDAYVLHEDMHDSGITSPIVNLDIQFQIDADQSYLFDMRSAVAMTNLFTNMEDSGASLCALLFAETDALPATFRMKVSGADRESVKLLFVKELIVQENVSDSTLENLANLQKKVEKLERDFPDKAKAYRHAGAIEKSSDLQAVKKAVEISNENDKKESV